MECFLHQNGGHPKAWCIDIHSPTELVVYFGLYESSLQTRIISTSNPHAEMQKRIAGKIKKGYKEVFGYIDEDNCFINSSSGRKTRQKPQPKAQEPTQSFDLSKLKNGNSFWF